MIRGMHPCWLAIALGAPPGVRAAEFDCLAEAAAALKARAPKQAVSALDQALADPRCVDKGPDLTMARALALHDVARAEGGEAWCAARMAYGALRESADAEYASAAKRGFGQTDEACETHRRGHTSKDPPPVAWVRDPWPEPEAPAAQPPPVRATDSGPLVLLLGGAGVAAVVGGGLFATAAWVDERHRNDLGSEQYLSGRDAAGGLTVGALAAVGVGGAMALGGLVWMLSADDDGPRPSAGPGTVGVQGRF